MGAREAFVGSEAPASFGGTLGAADQSGFQAQIGRLVVLE